MDKRLADALGQCKISLRRKLVWNLEFEGMREEELVFSIASLAPFPTAIESRPWKGC